MKYFERSIHINNAGVAREHRVWLDQQLAILQANPPPPVARAQALALLERSEHLEQSLQEKYPKIKRFSLEGLDSYLVALAVFIEQADHAGAKHMLLAMPHRGRINTLINIFGIAPEELYAAIERRPSDYFHAYDLPYHFGAVAHYRELQVSMLYNPSHLELINPVLIGQARALQEQYSPAEVLPVIAHGDAAFVGQGIVQETMNLSGLSGYSVGGTIHIILNNAIGFTAESHEYQSMDACTGIAAAFHTPVISVEAYDVDSVIHAAKLAFQFRQHFQKDVVLDIRGVRRLGHNEQDDPSITQPQLYRAIFGMVPIWAFYRTRLKQNTLPNKVETVCPLQPERSHKIALSSAQEAPMTALDKTQIERIAWQVAQTPNGFNAHPVVNDMLTRWQTQIAGGMGVDWAFAENLAYATLLAEHVPVRLTGMDCKRGTFHHRYAVWLDQETNEQYCPVNSLATAEAQLDIYNSPLSELACVGFEYGFSLSFPGLTMWEAQFGDFVNNAQAMIDQIIISAEQKWGYQSRLCINLPHGYEGYGPEHSSAFLGRFLALASDHNIRVEMPSTSAQWFHLLRRQALDPVQKPLIVFMPKDKLRKNTNSHSLISAFNSTTAQDLIYQPALAAPTRLIACSGKIFYDLIEAVQALDIQDVAIVRVERLYPFPTELWTQLIPTVDSITDYCWLQEEAMNHGAWQFIRDELAVCTGTMWRYAGRPTMAASADCDYLNIAAHQQAIVLEALDRSSVRQ